MNTLPIAEIEDNASVIGRKVTIPKVASGTYALLRVVGEQPPTAEGYWICEYPEFNDENCQSHWCPDGHGDDCSEPLATRQPRKHKECGRVTVVRGVTP